MLALWRFCYTLALMKTTALPAHHVALVCLALWLLTSLFVALVPTRYLTSDAVNNLTYITDDNRYELWHGQHLLALWPGYATAQLTERAYDGMRIAHSILAGATVAFLYLALLLLTDSGRIALGVALALPFSYGFWHYASDPDIYMAGYAAVALLLLALLAYLRAPDTRRLLWLGLAASLALLTHQMNIEIAGLIGLALIWLAARPGSIRVRWSHVFLYALLSLGPTLLLYVVGWRDASAWLARQSEATPGFVDWALRYFGAASSGEATWGVTLAPSTLPVAAYAIIQSWILPPLTRDLPALLVLGLLGVGGLLVGVHALTLARRLSPVERVVALVCVVSLIANAISGWWWQAGNIKFYLFMQLYVLVLLALYARVTLESRVARQLRAVGLAALASGLVLALGLLTLPYETQGGVFRLLDLYGDRPDVKLYIQDATQDRAIEYLSGRSARSLPEADCQTLPNYGSAPYGHIWVMSAERAQDCQLEGATFVDRYSADRSRTVWEIWDVTALTTPSE